MKELKDKSENENAKNSRVVKERFFKKWANERNLQENLEEYENMSLTSNCRSFKHSEI